MLKALYSLSFVVILFSISLIGACSSDDVDREPECDGSLTLSLSGVPTNPTTCSSADGVITVGASNGTAPYQYSINGGADQASATFSNLSQGTYSITVTDKNGCEDVLEGIVLEAPGSTLDLTANITPDTDCLANNGAFTLVGSGGTGTLTYSVDNDPFSETSTQFQGLAPGTFSASVKDANGCIKTIAVVVSQGNTGMSFSGIIKPIIDTNCATSSNCHASGVTSRPDLTEVSVIKSNAARIKSLTASGAMPKNGTLTENEKKQIACWVEDGAPTNN